MNVEKKIEVSSMLAAFLHFFFSLDADAWSQEIRALNTDIGLLRKNFKVVKNDGEN